MDTMVRLTKIKTFGCDKCGSVFHKKTKLLEHQKIHEHITSAYVLLTKEKLLKCKSCSESFHTIKEWKLHELKHMKLTSKYNNDFAKPYKCEECDAEFVLKSTLVAHSVLHAPFPHLCHCGVGYYNPGDYRQHRRLVHPEEFQDVKSDRRKRVKLLKIDEVEDKLQVKSPRVLEDYIPRTSYTGPKTKNGLMNDISESENEFPSSDSEPAAEYDTPYRPQLKAALAKKPNKIKSNKKTIVRNKNHDSLPLYFKDENGETVKIDKDINGTFPCPKCDTVCPKLYLIVQHYKANHANIFYFCEICNKSFTKKSAYNTDLAKHTGKFTCEVCKKVFGAKEFLTTHMRTHTKERPFPCSVCGKRFTQNGARTLHLKIHANIRDHKCQYCKKGFYSRSAMLLHERTHTGEKPYTCSYCNKKFSDPSAMARHIRTHTGDKRYACKLCPMRFSDASGLISHRRRHGPKNLSCDVCDYKCYDRDSLKRHVLSIHEAINRFQCYYCDKKFYRKSTLGLHITYQHWRELGLKMVKCRYCQNKFHTRNRLRVHERTHKILVHCDKCTRTFTSVKNLNIHKNGGHCKLSKSNEKYASEH